MGHRACDKPPANKLFNYFGRTDLVLVSNKELHLVELTYPFNSPESLLNSRKRIFPNDRGNWWPGSPPTSYSDGIGLFIHRHIHVRFHKGV